MPVSFDGKLVVAISSRALFNMDDSHHVYEEQGLEAYRQYQIDNEDVVLEPGSAYAMVKKLLAINDFFPENPRVEVILLSRNSADTGLRVFNSIEKHSLPITRAAFCGGNDPWRYVSAFGTHLFLSTDGEDVRQALEAGFAAATILPSPHNSSGNQSEQLKIAFDGDAVLFSDESERIYQEQGLDAFADNEKREARKPMMGGPFKSFLSALHSLQKSLPEDQSPIRTALVTARAAPAHERVVHTLRAWNVRIDESLFLGGLTKAEFLNAFGADIFFDDQTTHCSAASELVTSGHVPHGVANQK